jgi:hypothetical protein
MLRFFLVYRIAVMQRVQKLMSVFHAPRSPDLTPLDFYLWGYVKQIVYGVYIHNIQH